MRTVIPVAALGLGWIGVVIVVLVVLWLLTRVFEQQRIGPPDANPTRRHRPPHDRRLGRGGQPSLLRAGARPAWVQRDRALERSQPGGGLRTGGRERLRDLRTVRGRRAAPHRLRRRHARTGG